MIHVIDLVDSQTTLDVKKRNEAFTDDMSPDKVLEDGINEHAAITSRRIVDNLTGFIEKNKDEITAFRIIYSKPYSIRGLTLRDIKELANVVEKIPHSFIPALFWKAYQRLEKSRVKNNPKKILTELISIMRFTLGHKPELISFDARIDEKFDKWFTGQESAERKFTSGQRMVCYDQGSYCSVSYCYNGRHRQRSILKGRIRLYNLFGSDWENIV